MGSNHRPYILDPQNIVHRSSPHHDCMHNKKTTFKINWREVFKINEQIIQLPQGHMNFLLFVPFAIVRTVHAPHYAHSICQHLLLCTQRSKFEKIMAFGGCHTERKHERSKNWKKCGDAHGTKTFLWHNFLFIAVENPFPLLSSIIHIRTASAQHFLHFLFIISSKLMCSQSQFVLLRHRN